MLRGCGTDAFKSQITSTLPGNENSLEVAVRAMVFVYVVGSNCQIVLILLVGVLIIHKCKKDNTIESSNNTAQSSFNHHGLLWGCITVSFVGNGLLTSFEIFTIDLLLKSGVNELIAPGWIGIAQLVIITMSSLMVAICYGRKESFDIPSIFILPFVFLNCKYAEDILSLSEKIVRCLSIWSLLAFPIHVCYRANFVILALLARPLIVISTALLYIFAVFYSIHLLATLFAFAKAKKKEQENACVPTIVINLAQTLAFMVAFATALCFGIVISFVGVLPNYGTIRNSPYSILSTLLTPLAFAGLGWALRIFGFQWLKTVTSHNTAKENKTESLLQVIGNECATNEPLLQVGGNACFREEGSHC